MAMQTGGRKGGAMSEINVTPMADIMIVLLIIFMVITPMLQKGVDVKLPQAAHSKTKEDKQKQVVVAINKDGDAFIGGIKKPDLENEFLPQLREKVEELPDTEKVIFLKAHSELKYSRVVEVMGFCRDAGAEEIALIVDKKVGS
jgi:biopolymer transport protein TolR